MTERYKSRMDDLKRKKGRKYKNGVKRVKEIIACYMEQLHNQTRMKNE